MTATTIGPRDLFEDLHELRTYASTFKEQDRVIASAETDVDRLSTLVGVIEHYGITESTLMALDPHQELVSLGVVPAYETLAITSTSSDTSSDTSVIDKIKEVIKTIWNKLIEFLKTVGKTLKAWAVKIFDTLINIEDLVTLTSVRVNRRMKKSKIDKVKLSSIEIKGSSKENTLDMLEAALKFQNLIFSQNLLKGLGDWGKMRMLKSSDIKSPDKFSNAVETVESRNDEILERLEQMGKTLTETVLEQKEDTLGGLGWNIEDILEFLNTTLRFTKDIRQYKDGVKVIIRANDNFITSLATALKDVKDFRGEKELLTLKNRLVQSNRKIFTKYRQLTVQLFNKMIALCRYSNQLGRLALKAF